MSELPTKDQLLAWINAQGTRVAKRDIARAFNVKGAQRIELKRLLRELSDEGVLEQRKRRVGKPDQLPPMTVLVIDRVDSDGDLWARPQDWPHEDAPPTIQHVTRAKDAALGVGDRFLGRLTRIGDGYESRLFKKLHAGPRRLLGVFRADADDAGGGRVLPVDRKSDAEWMIPPGATDGAQDGELVEAEATSGPRAGLPRGRIVARLGDPSAPGQVSLIALHRHAIPDAFPAEVLADAEAAAETGMTGRTDLRDLPFVTIDPADARDHDDAVTAMPDPDVPDGHVVWVAIADVAAYVRPGSALDREARRRGNSTYFPDRVAPMLPERLSTDLCSLRENVDRPCIAVEMRLDAAGQMTGHRFVRAMIRSRADLTYERVQAAMDGAPDAVPEGMLDTVVQPLFAAYRAAAQARDAREPLDLDLPERRVELDPDGTVAAIRVRDRLEAHRLIEEFMILANVAAAETLEKKRTGLIYRVHEEPDPERLDGLRETVEPLGLTLAKGQVLKTGHINRLLRAARETDGSEMVSMAVLRAQTQAYYAPERLGHFGLNLPSYAHFTSPIRRYADLVVHRALISAHRWGKDGLGLEDADRLGDTAEHISQTERRSVDAERETVDRYVAAYMADRTGATFTGRVSGVAKFGLFVKLDETGGDGLIPVSTLGTEYFRFDPEQLTLEGERSGTLITLGAPVTVRLVEASPLTGGLLFELLEIDANRLPTPRRRASGPAPRRKLNRARLAKAKSVRRKR